MDESQALPWLYLPNAHGKPNSDVLRPWVNGNALVTVRRALWIIDPGVAMPLQQMAGYEKPFKQLLQVANCHFHRERAKFAASCK